MAKLTFFVPQASPPKHQLHRPGPPRRGLSPILAMHSKMKWSTVVCCLLFFVSSAASQLVPSTPRPTQPPVPSVPPIPAPTPGVNPAESIPVVISYGENQETRVQVYRGLMQPAGVPAGQSVTVTLLLSSMYAGQVVALGLYDGGQVGQAAPPGTPINPPIALHVALDGKVQFNFRAGQTLGLYRLLVTVGPAQFLLQFYAVTPGSAGGPLPVPTPSRTPVPPSPPPIG